MRLPIPQQLLDLPESPEKAELVWCCALSSMVDFGRSSFEAEALARATNAATEVAIRLLRERAKK